MPRGADGTPRTTFRRVVTSVRAYLIRTMGLDPTHIFRSARELGKQTNIPGQLAIALRSGGFEVDGEWTDSEGRLATAVDRDLVVQPYLRISTDDVVRDDVVADQLWAIEDRIIDLIQIAELDDILEPMHLRSGSDEEAFQITPRFITSKLHFSVKFLQAVNQSRQ